LKFGEQFEQRFLKQNKDESRSIEETLEIAWEILSMLPRDELTRIHTEFLKKYYKK
jgi:V/A-type H+-transporting ATPase subunit B